jgi:hypothetical protein
MNIDGSFCLYWAEAEHNAIVDEISAGNWWGKLPVFLKRQQSASVLRHYGAEAARAQLIAERTASELGPRFRDMLDDIRTIRQRSAMRIGRRHVTTSSSRGRLGRSRAILMEPLARMSHTTAA